MGAMSGIQTWRWSAEVVRAVRFCLVGLAGLAVDAGVFAALHAAGSGRAGARAASLIVATLVTWFLNRRLTFAPTGRERHLELARYAAVALVAQGFNYGLFLFLGVLAPQIPPVDLIPICAVAAAGLSFVGQRFFTFGAPPSLAGDNA
jgi:putative flippase GtrA